MLGLKEMLDSKFANGKNLSVVAENGTGTTIEFPVTVRIDTPQEILYYQHGGSCSMSAAAGGEGVSLKGRRS